MTQPYVADHTGRSPLYKGFQECCRAILASGQNGAGMSFAKSYAQAGLHLSTSAGIKTQALYIVENLRGWRDPNAATVRTTLRMIAQGHPERPHLARKLDSSKDLASAMLQLKDLEE